MTRRIASDCETHAIKDGAVAPRLVCLSLAERVAGTDEVETDLIGNGDPHLEEACAALFDPGTESIWHNACFDLTVIAAMFPRLLPHIWQALEDGRVYCTIVREKLINLSGHGHLRDLELEVNGETVWKVGAINYQLETLVRNYLGYDRSASKTEDAWRSYYSTLEGKRADEYPRDAWSYPQQDARDTLEVFELQELRLVHAPAVTVARQLAQEVGRGTETAETQEFQVGADFALRLMTCTGIAIDHVQKDMLLEKCRKALDPTRLPLIYAHGIVRSAIPARPYAKNAVHGAPKPGAKPCSCAASSHAVGVLKLKAAERESVNRKVLIALVEKTCADNELDLKKTEKGNTSTDKEVLENLADYCTILKQYGRRQNLQKIVNTELPRLSGALAYPVFDVLKETGRTSSYHSELFPSLNIQNVMASRDTDECSVCGHEKDDHEKDDHTGKCGICSCRDYVEDAINVRECFVPRDTVWLDTPRVYRTWLADGSEYLGLGSADLTQQKSVLCSIDYASLEFVSLAQTTYSLFGYSVLRDRINAGIDPHAYLGAQLARALDSSFADDCDKAQAGLGYGPMEIYEYFVSHKNHRDPGKSAIFEKYRKLAKPVGFGYPGGLGPRTFIGFAKAGYKIDVDFDTAVELKRLFLETYPEIREYFNYITTECRDENFSGEQQKYCYTTPLGMYRANATYCAATNGRGLQSPAAEGAKLAVFEIMRECWDETRGSILFGQKPLAFIHDEILFELAWDRLTHERAFEASRVMVSAMERIMPDVRVSAEPTLMVRWNKRAQTVYDRHKRLSVWFPRYKQAKSTPKQLVGV